MQDSDNGEHSGAAQRPWVPGMSGYDDPMGQPDYVNPEDTELEDAEFRVSFRSRRDDFSAAPLRAIDTFDDNITPEHWGDALRSINVNAKAISSLARAYGTASIVFAEGVERGDHLLCGISLDVYGIIAPCVVNGKLCWTLYHDPSGAEAGQILPGNSLAEAIDALLEGGENVHHIDISPDNIDTSDVKKSPTSQEE